MTGRRGTLVVTDVRAYEPSKISLDPMELGDSVTIDTPEQWIRPSARAGVPVRFGLREMTGARVLLIGADGMPIPAGSRAMTKGGAEAPVGLDGELFLEAVEADNHLRVTIRGGGSCVASFQRPSGTLAVLPRIGPMVCAVERVAAR